MFVHLRYHLFHFDFFLQASRPFSGALLPYTFEKKNTKCIVIMSIKPSFYIKKFMTPGTRAQELEWEEYGYNVKIY